MFQKIALLSGVLMLSGFTVYNVFSNVKQVSAVGPCIVTVLGVQYDVAPLQVAGVHPGGNVFVCNTDMTNLFMSMPTHTTDIARMTPYIFVATTAVPTVVPTVAPTVTSVPSVVPTVTPMLSVSPAPLVSPAPSISPTPHHEDDKNEVEEIETEVNDHRDESRKEHKSERVESEDKHKQNS